MSKQFVVHFVSWRDAPNAPIGLFADAASLGRAAAAALEIRLNLLAAEGFIIDAVHPAAGVMAKEGAGFTIVAFK